MLRARPAFLILLSTLFLALAMPASAQSVLTGFLNLVWEDPVDGSASRLLAFLTVGGATIPIEFGASLQPDLVRLNGQRVSITGNPVQLTASGRGNFQVEGIQGIDIAPGTTPAGSGNLASGPLLSGPQPWVTILCRFADSTNITPNEPSYHAGQLMNDAQNASSYWREVSYDNIQLTGSTVAGWFNLPQPRSAYGSSANTDIRLLAEDCSAAADDVVNFTSYVGINFVFNQGTGDPYRGGSVRLTRDGLQKNWRSTWLYNTYNLAYLLHEMGHAFGFPHSSGPYGETYDSRWDVMSGAVPAVHTISYHKDLNGWIPAGRIVTVDGGSSAVVTLEALSVPATGTLPLMVKIPIGGFIAHFYTVELRRRTGYDSSLNVAFPASGNAVVIHDVTSGRGITTTAALVVDPDHNGNPNDAGATWTAGEIFDDNVNGVRVEVTSETSSTVTLVISHRGEPIERVFFSTLAGLQGSPGAADGTGNAARFNNPDGLAIDGSGNVYVADYRNSAIRRITPAGVVTTFAGVLGSPGFVDAAGATARFNSLFGLTIGPGGILYVADYDRIRKVTPAGVVSTLAQLPTPGTAVAVDASETVYVASISGVIYRITSGGVVSTLAGLAGSSGTTDGDGATARFNSPSGIAVNSAGVVYVADTFNQTIRRISPSGTVTTFAGLAGTCESQDGAGSAARFCLPRGLAMNSDGSFYAADRNTIRRITPAGTVALVGGKQVGGSPPGVDGEGDSARFGEPHGLAVDASGTIYTADYANHTIRIGTRTSLLEVSTAALRFGATRANGQFVRLTPPQEVTITAEGAPQSWTAVADQPWVQIASGAGTGAGRFTVSVADVGNLLGAATVATANITLASLTLGTTTMMSVVLTIQAPAGSAAPFGAFDTPASNATNVAGAIAVTGWTLDDVGVTMVQLWRNCIETIDRPAGACTSSAPGQPPNFVYIGDAAFLAGARPDVEVANLGTPLSYRAGWGYLMSTNALPHLPSGQGAGGQGVFTLSASAIDVEGQFTLLGQKTITIDNDNASIPFGVLDTPTQGGTITVSPYASFGWAMTQSTPTLKCIDVTSTASWKVYIDGVSLPLVPNVNWFPGLTRPDIAAAYPGRCNTNNALAAYYIDANALGLANGLHTTGWDVIDNQGQVAGIGSRFFNVLIGAGGTDTVGPTFRSGVDNVPYTPDLKVGPTLGPTSALGMLAPAPRGVRVQIGPDSAPTKSLTPDAGGRYQVQFGIGGRIALDLGGAVEAGYQVVGDELRALPAGSTLDAANGTFAWQPPVPFLGPFHLIFTSGAERIDVHATIVDPTVTTPIAMHIDTPAGDSTVTGSFIIAGWALDPLASTGSGIDTLHVWAYRRDGVSAPQFLGAATIGGRRPDVAAIHGAQFQASGFTLSIPDLAPGVYDLVVHPWSHRAGRFEPAQTVRVVVR